MNYLKMCAISFTLICCSASMAQLTTDIVAWKVSASKIKKNTYKIIATAHIKSGWHIYANGPSEGWIPTRLELGLNPLLETQGASKEIGKKITKTEASFNSARVGTYETQLVVEQIVLKKTDAPVKATLNISYMACNSSSCTPPKKQSETLSLD